MAYDGYEWRPYVPVAERRCLAAREMARLRRKGRSVTPAVIEGPTIARSSRRRPGSGSRGSCP